MESKKRKGSEVSAAAENGAKGKKGKATEPASAKTGEKAAKEQPAAASAPAVSSKPAAAPAAKQASKAAAAAAPPPAKPSEDELLDKVKELDRGLRESRANINNAVELTRIMKAGFYDSVTFKAAKALQRMFADFQGTVELSLKPKPRSEGGLVTAEEQLAQWLQKHYLAFFAALCELLSHPEPALQIMALEAITGLLQQEGEFRKEKYSPELHPKLFFPSEQVQQVVTALAHSEHLNEKLFQELERLLDFDDVKLAALFAIGSIVKGLQGRNPAADEKAALLQRNVLELLRRINLRRGEESLEPLKFFNQPPVQDEDKKAKDPHDFRRPKNHRKAATDAWLGLLHLDLAPDVYKDALAVAHDHIIPSLTNPAVLIDFLRDSYEKGGVVSILALHGLFVLIRDHNLDYPDFYRKLYALFEPSIFHMKHRDRFFRLASLFLSSTHLPAYIVAAFIKRLARLALHGPPHAALVAVPMMYNLLRRHPKCAVLLHREPAARQEAPVINIAEEKAGRDPNLGRDPYNYDEPDLSKCRAMDSSLWELEILGQHYHPNVVRLVRVFDSGHFEKKAFDLDTFVQLSFQSEFESLSAYRKNVAAPQAFKLPPTLFPVDDLTTQYMS